jgi:threonine aldolase
MADGLVDLRSDTVTRPTPEMRRAMAEAEVGDDGYGEDPTVRRLEEEFAARVGKEAALLVPSGTMANQVALRVLTFPGSAVVAGRRQHVVAYEHGAAGRNAGVQFHEVDDGDGTFQPDEVRWAIGAAAHHHVTPSLVSLEHPHMAAGGVPWPLACLGAVSEAARAASLPVHMDGARLFNAEVATGVPAATSASCATTVMACLTKGLCGPVGSVLAGPADLIEQAREERLVLGGGMRQAGVIAAAGLVALRSMIERLALDHERAGRLADAVAGRFADGGCEPARPRTNIVVFRHSEPDRLLEHLRAHGVLAGTIDPETVRLVTHHDVDDKGTERACRALAGAP